MNKAMKDMRLTTLERDYAWRYLRNRAGISGRVGMTGIGKIPLTRIREINRLVDELIKRAADLMA